jgi:hypothetical protein|tara:strand:- start:2606 stop:2794 length:189 start_codon:yes stop_codon:yes gene_type:complete
MTELMIKTLKNKSLKEKIAASKARTKIETEITNYEEGVRRGGQFVAYNEDMIAKLKLRLEDL